MAEAQEADTARTQLNTTMSTRNARARGACNAVPGVCRHGGGEDARRAARVDGKSKQNREISCPQFRHRFQMREKWLKRLWIEVICKAGKCQAG